LFPGKGVVAEWGQLLGFIPGVLCWEGEGRLKTVLSPKKQAALLRSCTALSTVHAEMERQSSDLCGQAAWGDVFMI
jgi:hypothetical protein